MCVRSHLSGPDDGPDVREAVAVQMVRVLVGTVWHDAQVRDRVAGGGGGDVLREGLSKRTQGPLKLGLLRMSAEEA